MKKSDLHIEPMEESDLESCFSNLVIETSGEDNFLLIHIDGLDQFVELKGVSNVQLNHFPGDGFEAVLTISNPQLKIKSGDSD